MVSAEYFDTLGVPAMIGRTLSPQDGPKPTLAVISHDFWQRRLNGRADALGATVALRLATFTVIGIMPPAFFGETVGDAPDVWLPLSMQPVVMPGRDWLNDDPAPRWFRYGNAVPMPIATLQLGATPLSPWLVFTLSVTGPRTTNETPPVTDRECPIVESTAPRSAL